MNWLLKSLKIVTLNSTSSECYLFDDNGCGYKWDGPTPFQNLKKKPRTDTPLFPPNVINQLILSYKSNETFSSQKLLVRCVLGQVFKTAFFTKKEIFPFLQRIVLAYPTPHPKEVEGSQLSPIVIFGRDGQIRQPQLFTKFPIPVILLYTSTIRCVNHRISKILKGILTFLTPITSPPSIPSWKMTKILTNGHQILDPFPNE